MEEDRVEKRVVRRLWLTELQRYAGRYREDCHPLLLTLPGRLGREIDMLIENDLLDVTETGAIDGHHAGRAIAVEHDGLAVSELQGRFPGLKILERPFHNLLRGDGLFTWPSRGERQYCRARVVNLDLNRPLMGGEGELGHFPILVWIEKLLQLHTDPEQLHWTLCLTLQGETPWRGEHGLFVQRFMRNNLGLDEGFRDRVDEALSCSLVEVLRGELPIDFSGLPVADQQRLLMVFVPKRIAQAAHGRGWRIITRKNLRYGGGGRAPMVTWVIEFVPEARLVARADEGYREALRNIFMCFGQINGEGEYEPA